MAEQFTNGKDFIKLIREHYDIPRGCERLQIDASANGVVNFTFDGILTYQQDKKERKKVFLTKSAPKEPGEYYLVYEDGGVIRTSVAAIPFCQGEVLITNIEDHRGNFTPVNRCKGQWAKRHPEDPRLSEIEFIREEG